MRRLTFFAGALVAAASLSSLSSCATFDNADTVANVNGQELTLGQLQLLTDGSTAGDTTRQAITKWVQASLVTDTSNLQSATDLDERTQAASTSMFAEFEDEARAEYEKGIDGPLLCFAVIPIAADVDPAAVLAEWSAGATFAELLQTYSLDAALVESGGIVEGSECLAPVDTNTELLLSLVESGVKVGTPVAITFSEQPFIFLLRPFDELSTEVKTQLAAPAFQAAVRELLTSAEVSVDSRYGAWDSATGSVVALGQG